MFAAEPQPAAYARRDTWVETLLASRDALNAATLPKQANARAAQTVWESVRNDFPVECDWAMNDSGGDFSSCLTGASSGSLSRWIPPILMNELGESGFDLRQKLDELRSDQAPALDRRWLELYVNACTERRSLRLRSVLNQTPSLLFVRRAPDRGSELCLLDLGQARTVRTLVEDQTGEICNPAVSWQADRVVFAWKKAGRQESHLYELAVATREIRPLTSGEGVADFEPAFLPNGDLIFASTRCAEMSADGSELRSLFTCDPDGRFLRRLTFDSGQARRPRVLPDGRVIWENLEGKSAPARFQMNADGTDQQLCRSEDECAPAGEAARLAGLTAQMDGVFRLAETEFLAVLPFASRTPTNGARTAIYWIGAKGRRELLVADPSWSCGEPVPLAPRPLPFMRASAVDYAKATGTIFVQDLYAGLPQAPRGSIRTLRVQAVERAPAGAILAWPGDPCEIRVPLGEVRVFPDGSAFFNVPARTPLSFQALDTNGRAVWTSRGSRALQPGETLACVSLDDAGLPPQVMPGRLTSLAARAGAQEPALYSGPAPSFRFSGENQPAVERQRRFREEDRQSVAELAAQQPASHGPVGPAGSMRPTGPMRPPPRWPFPQ